MPLTSAADPFYSFADSDKTWQQSRRQHHDLHMPYLYGAVAAVEDVHTLLGIRLVYDQAAIAGVVFYRPLAA